MEKNSSLANTSVPQKLYEVLEDEILTIHGDRCIGSGSVGATPAAVSAGGVPIPPRPDRALINPAYVKDRQTAVENVEKAIVTEKRKAHPHASDAELKTRVEAELAKKPLLTNGAACKVLFGRIHEMERTAASEGKDYQHTALCLSGGGIRSATFALGVLQGLADKGLLGKFTYLSTVSGGGYIGSWLSSWIHRSGSAEVLETLKGGGDPTTPPNDPSTNAPADQSAAAQPSVGADRPFETEPETIHHLRSYSNYLTPSLGLLSGDGWAVAATVVRNLLLNWLVLVPAFLLVLLIPRAALRLELHPLGENPAAGYVAVAVAFLAGVWALAKLIVRDARDQENFLMTCIAPLVLSCASITIAWFWARTAFPGVGYFACEGQRIFFYMGWGAATAVLAVILAALLGLRKKPEAPKPVTQKGDEPKPTAKTGLVWRAPWLMAIFALAGLLVWWLGDKAAEPLRVAERLTRHVESVTKMKVPDLRRVLYATRVDARDEAAKEMATRPDIKCQLEQIEDSRMHGAITAVCFGFPILIGVFFLASVVLSGVLSHRMPEETREWLARASGWAFLIAIAVCGLDLVVLKGPVWLVSLWDYAPKWLASISGGSALITIFGGKSAKTQPANQGEAAKKPDDQKSDLSSKIVTQATKFAAPIFAIFLVMLMALLLTVLLQKIYGDDANPRAHINSLEFIGLRYIGLLAAALIPVAWLMSARVNINKFSLNAMYRNRLIRAYLGASNQKRNPNPFTGFDEKDNLCMAELRGQRPFHVVNTALNLVSGKNLAWQQRMAQSFTMTPLTCGSATLGYRDSAEYARSWGGDRAPITLGTALSISGAAVSPNHGYNSSPLVAFLLTFFNARLGGWFGNPGVMGAKTWDKGAPRLALHPLVEEAFGLTDDEHPYVYLSDGGHFENLGIYEMVMRRCRCIVVSDAGCDADYSFEDLANAVAKIRVDFGIRIDFDEDISIKDWDRKSDHPSGSRHCAVGTIHYSEVDGGGPDRDGVLIYIKPALSGDEPMDVYHYARQHPDFPHEPTTDQWFSESQFESYRMLGCHSIDEICKGAPGGTLTLREFKTRAEKHVARTGDSKPAILTPA